MRRAGSNPLGPGSASFDAFVARGTRPSRYPLRREALLDPTGGYGNVGMRCGCWKRLSALSRRSGGRGVVCDSEALMDGVCGLCDRLCVDGRLIHEVV